MRSQVTEGASALLLMTSGGVADRVREALKGQQFELIATNLSTEQEEKLRTVFSEDEVAAAHLAFPSASEQAVSGAGAAAGRRPPVRMLDQRRLIRAQTEEPLRDMAA